MPRIMDTNVLYYFKYLGKVVLIHLGVNNK